VGGRDAAVGRPAGPRAQDKRKGCLSLTASSAPLGPRNPLSGCVQNRLAAPARHCGASTLTREPGGSSRSILAHRREAKPCRRCWSGVWMRATVQPDRRED
jgi:hypothetical protein